MDKQHYFFAPIEAFDEKGLALSLPRALVSRRGIHRFLEESEIAQRAFLESRLFTVQLEGRQFFGRLEREQGSEGVHYNLKLLADPRIEEEELDGRLTKSGFESPWKREFPRIPVAPLMERLEVPERAIFPRFGARAIAEVVNFSHHGLLCRFPVAGLSLGEYVGLKVQLQIITNRSRSEGRVEGQVMRIYDEMVAPGKIQRSIGLKFIDYQGSFLEFYQGLILDACRGLT